MGVTSGPTTILTAPRVLEARNLSTEQLDPPQIETTRLARDDYPLINMRSWGTISVTLPPHPLPLLEETETDVGFHQGTLNRLHYGNILPISNGPLNPPPSSGILRGQRARNGNSVFHNSPLLPKKF